MTTLAQDLFVQASELPAAERDAFLAQVCGDDAELRLEIQRLLVDAARADSFFGDGDGSTLGAEEFKETYAEKPGDVIGPYKLREQIGEGGFGSVWVADQEKPVRRRVALKLVKAGMDTKQVIARFEQERQALAMMDHPNIAKVFDAGTSGQGRPYFVMELVRGVPITEYCDEKALDTKQRLDLFILVCQAVQHAHQKGIIHRDLKPSNILVTVNDGKPVPKVIDFGVAKATQGRLVEQTIYTQFQQMIGTPLYMSPEQADMTSLDVDTRSDIYSLGVLLYELLTGRTPIDASTMREAGLDEMRRIIREVDPPRPSLRLKTLDDNDLTTTAKRRHTEPAKLPHALRGDLDWIVMKCLEKDRMRRYDTANGLAMDLQRHLHNDVITARPPTTAYRVGRLIRRNKAAFVAASAVVLALVIGIVASTWQAVRAKSAEQRAVAAFDELRATAPAFAEQARALAAKEQYSEAVEKLDYAIRLQPEAAEFLVAKADLLQCQFKLEEAASIYRAALALQAGHARAGDSLKLCDELLAAPPDADGKLTRESLGKLRLAMLKQQRPAAELLPVARLLGAEKEHLVAYWLDRLKDLPISPEKPLKDRLTVLENGLLELDLRQTLITDLAALAGMPLGKLTLGNCRLLADFAPLREFRSLTYLNLDGTQITDLSVLRGLPLEMLFIAGTKVSDLSPLRGMKLERLVLGCPRVSDLSPLEGMPLTLFVAMDLANGTDFSPLKGLPLESCMIMRCAITDLSFLSACPLKELGLYIASPLRGLGWLKDIQTLERLVLPSNFRNFADDDLQAIAALRNHPRLAFIQADSTSSNESYSSWHLLQVSQPKEVFWRDWDREQAFLPAIRATGFDFTLQKLPDDTYYLRLESQPLRDLSILKGAPISGLWIGATKVTDLSPIADLPLRSLGIWSTEVTDISPLRNMRLEELSLGTGAVDDLTPLADMPLRKLYMHQCKEVGDLTPLFSISTLQSLTIPVTAQNIESLRNLKNLKWLGFSGDSRASASSTPVELFWERWAGMEWSRQLNESGTQYTAYQDLSNHWLVTVTSREFSDTSIFKGAAIRQLTLADTSVADLRPLEDLALTKLDLRRTQVRDLSPLRSPTLGGSLRQLVIRQCNIADFSPLAACTNLEILDATGTDLDDADLEHLRGRRLDKLELSQTKVTDLSVLAGMPLTVLRLEGTTATDLSPLLECPRLSTIVIPHKAKNVSILKDLPALGRLSYKTGSNETPEQKAADFWKEYDTSGWRNALREAGIVPKSLKRLEDGTWELNLEQVKINDLSVLRGAPISMLRLTKTAVHDLSPLKGIPLTKLYVNGTAVENLEPLRDMALTDLSLADTKVSDLSVLRGMPLVSLKLGKCTEIKDLSPLRDCETLTELTLPPNADDIGFLRDLPALAHISHTENADAGWIPDKSREEFWTDHDARQESKAEPR
jgi:serine/threonine protein kinase/Leucine-rich repeat (LRR) protein